jgi:hypothetical protein
MFCMTAQGRPEPSNTFRPKVQNGDRERGPVLSRSLVHEQGQGNTGTSSPSQG